MFVYKILIPAKHGAPGGAVQVPLSLLSGQWPRQKQVMPCSAADIPADYSELTTAATKFTAAWSAV